ncbi:O-phosphoseryl-tRNA(Sec) selenium transferase [Hypsibius exemplaris]|uniref:O-phosphoseryl-tRNA(Sec) selenium transferase n=1 Tax=Hypsibius exemplaris TaxID=2072580 RepID=A0A1W0X9W5_HYPEX|nr:O-phosphoseryl-tRNA(Sec) selenium transferase [Hypsibius exemplaris]
MDGQSYELCMKILPKTYVQQADDAKSAARKSINLLLEQKRIPEVGFSDVLIRCLLSDLADMDSSNFPANCGAGEREGRIFSGLVADRHFRMSHGVGRSGELTAVQPKAAGSSIIAKLADSLALHALKIAGAIHVATCFVVPSCTGMTLCLTFLALRKARPSARYIIWPRVDQKSCFKSMLTAGYIPVVIENIMVEDELCTHVSEIACQIEKLGAENILCVHSTTSCFAPRAPDNLPAIARLCKSFGIPHVVNNAYGTQSSKCMHLVEEAARVGRVDAFVQSLDKNYMVPVGGCLFASYDPEFAQAVSCMYPGRASAAPSLDLLVTLLSMGVTRYKQLLKERKETFNYLKYQLEVLAAQFQERVLRTPSNHISLALTLSTLDEDKCTMLGSMLFLRGVSGARVVPRAAKQVLEDHAFLGFGSHTNTPSVPYLTVAAAIGMTNDEVNVFVSRFEKAFAKLRTPSTAPADRDVDTTAVGD